MKYSIYLIFLLLSLSATSQNSKLKFEKKKIDHGSVDDWANPPARFVFTNNGYSNLSFLPTFHTQDLLVVLPKKPVPPRAKAEILVYYYTADRGAFSKNVEIYSNFDTKPLKLTVKGDIKSFSSSAHLSCPGAPPVDDPVAIYEQKVLVFDAETGKPIQGAKVQFKADKKEKYTDRTLKGGFALVEMPPGLYSMEVSMTEYYPHFDSGYINRSTGTISVELRPKPKPVEETAAVPKKEKATPVAPQTPQPPRFKEATKENNEPVVKEKPKAKEKPAEAVEPVVVRQEEPEEPEEPAIPEFDERTGRLSEAVFQPNNIVFLIDVSLSMRDDNKLEELKSSMIRLADRLRDIDQLTIITYNNRSAVAMQTTNADEKAKIKEVIDGLVPKGSTRGVKGLEKAYRTAQENFIFSGNNQIILATDGKFSEVDTDDKSFYRIVKNGAKDGVILSVLGFGQDKKAASVMGKLARSGKGSYFAVTRGDGEQVLLEEIMNRSRKN